MRTRWDLMPRRVKRPGMLAGGDGSTLSLDFTAMSSLDSRFTFTRASTATYINSSGLVTTMAAASTNDPTKARFDYDPTTLAPRGLLIEGSATNLVLNSSSFTGGWFFTGTGTKSTTNNYATAPDGTTTAARLQLGQNCALKQIAGATGVNHTVSIWVKSNTGSNQTIAFWTGSAAANRTATTSWTRIEAVVNNANPTLFDLYNPNATDCDVLIWGAQLETGSGASSYIPTGASTVQRAADSCSIAASSSWLNTASGTFLATWSRGDIGTSARTAISTDYVAGRLLSLNNTNTTGTVVLDWWSGNINRTTGSSSNKAAYTYGQTTGSGATLQLPVRLCVNGSAVATGTFGNGTTNGANVPNPVNWTNFVIGAASESAPYTTASRDWLNNCVRSIKYWPTVLPDATLQSLTQ